MGRCEDFVRAGITDRCGGAGRDRREKSDRKVPRRNDPFGNSEAPEYCFYLSEGPGYQSLDKGPCRRAAQLAEALGEAVSVRNYFGADTQEATESILNQAAADGAELIFTTPPPLLSATLKAAVRYPKIRFFNCSVGQALSSVRSYYCRVYEEKFITGLIAGALAENDLVGYVGSYPIFGIPAAINAFALGARMTNPRARILLEWSCTDGDPEKLLTEKGVRVISNRDVPLPGAVSLGQGNLGTYLLDENGKAQPLASPCWMWGKLYENIVRSALSGDLEDPAHRGFEAFLELIDRYHPQIFLHGHTHLRYHAQGLRETDCGGTRVINAGERIVFELPDREVPPKQHNALIWVTRHREEDWRPMP